MIYFIVFILFLGTLYGVVGFSKIYNRYRMYLSKEYWTDYNTIEFISWMAKAAIIIPGLIFGIEIWWLHFLTLTTSSLLIWASMKKSLPTLILFNTIWICISLSIIIKHIGR